MFLTGRHVDASYAPSQHMLSQRRTPNTASSEGEVFNPLEEEIFEKDGVIEDIIAVDYKTTWVEETLYGSCLILQNNTS